jgi:hypothetical protein
MLITTLLLACGDEKTDTAEPSGEPTTEPSEEPSEEPVIDSAFPELMSEFMDAKVNAMPFPLGEEGMQDNITVLAMYGYSIASSFEIQLSVAFLPEGETLDCPIIEGTFPEDGWPTEDIVVTGGCTNTDGVEYQGSFTYGPTGIVYDNYYTKRPSENCPDEYEESTFNGGSFFDIENSNIEVLVTTDSVSFNDDCSTEATTMWMQSILQRQETSATEEVTNGTGVLLVSYPEGSVAVDIVTTDERIDDTVCESEPLSGTNTLSNGTDTLEFTFDGETDCDEEPTQMLSINGGDPVEVAGASCSTLGQRQGIIVLFLSLLPLWIRKRS